MEYLFTISPLYGSGPILLIASHLTFLLLLSNTFYHHHDPHPHLEGCCCDVGGGAGGPDGIQARWEDDVDTGRTSPDTVGGRAHHGPVLSLRPGAEHQTAAPGAVNLPANAGAVPTPTEMSHI